MTNAQILDYKLFTPGQPLKNGTFWLCEQVCARVLCYRCWGCLGLPLCTIWADTAVQVPGYIRSNDLSQLLQTNGHFGSCMRAR